MNNSVFGKTMENLQKRVDVRLVTNEKKLLKQTSKPTYVSSKIFNENLVAVHKIKEALTLNRPAYVGMCILDLNKTLMYDFHYNYIKNKYGDRAKLLFTDTDSLRLQLHCAIYRPDSFVLTSCHCANLKAIRYESTSLNRIVADKSQSVIVA